MSADQHRDLDLSGEGLGPAVASVSRPGYEASLHLERATQQLWLVERSHDSHGEDWTAAAAHDALAASFAQGRLIVGGQVSLPTVDVEAVVGARVQANARRRFALGLRQRFGRLARETHSYP